MEHKTLILKPKKKKKSDRQLNNIVSQEVSFKLYILAKKEQVTDLGVEIIIKMWLNNNLFLTWNWYNLSMLPFSW